MKRKLAVFNWSGGKDSTLALHYALQNPAIEIKYLLTTVNETCEQIAIHGVRVELLRSQAKSIGNPLIEMPLPTSSSMQAFEKAMHDQMLALKKEGITCAVFGDIFLEDLKVYRESQLKLIGVECIFPIWQRNARSLIRDFLNLSYQTVLVCVREDLKGFLGRIIDDEFINDLPSHIDPCGENGEFHTFAFAGPIFKNPIGFTLGASIYQSFPNPNKKEKVIGFWYQDLLPSFGLLLLSFATIL